MLDVVLSVSHLAKAVLNITSVLVVVMSHLLRVECLVERHQRRQFGLLVRFRVLVDPVQLGVTLVLIHVLVVDHLTHLGVEERVSDHHFFVLEFLRESLAFETHVLEVRAECAETSTGQALLVHLKLLDEVASDLQIGSALVHELKTFEHAPSELAHEVGHQRRRTAALTPDGVD